LSSVQSKPGGGLRFIRRTVVARKTISTICIKDPYHLAKRLGPCCFLSETIKNEAYDVGQYFKYSEKSEERLAYDKETEALGL
jgi:hypothetical protein